MPFVRLCFLFLLSIAQASELADGPRAPHCLGLLRASSSLKEVESAFTQAVYEEDYRDGGEKQLELLTEMLNNHVVLAALEHKHLNTFDHFKRLLNSHAPQEFYRAAIGILNEKRPPHYRELVKMAADNLLDEGLPPPSAMPAAVFQEIPIEGVVSHDVRSALGSIFSYNGGLQNENITRRVEAYLGRYPHLDQKQKYNLVVNFLREANRLRMEYQQRERGVAIVKEFEFYQIGEAPDGTRIICSGLNCLFFFAITKEGTFYRGMRINNGRGMIPSEWNSKNSILREAGS